MLCLFLEKALLSYKQNKHISLESVVCHLRPYTHIIWEYMLFILTVM